MQPVELGEREAALFEVEVEKPFHALDSLIELDDRQTVCGPPVVLGLASPTQGQTFPADRNDLFDPQAEGPHLVEREELFDVLVGAGRGHRDQRTTVLVNEAVGELFATLRRDVVSVAPPRENRSQAVGRRVLRFSCHEWMLERARIGEPGNLSVGRRQSARGAGVGGPSEPPTGGPSSSCPTLAVGVHIGGPKASTSTGDRLATCNQF